MLICLDVHYLDQSAVTAGVGFRAWESEDVGFSVVSRQVGSPHPYQPGAFYRRELPLLQTVFQYVMERPKIVVVDGYVRLGESRAGLGAHLYHALGETTAVVGVAKNRFASAQGAIEVKRGESSRPLYVSAIGMAPEAAAEGVRRMAGPYRIPTMLKTVDSLARSLAQGGVR
ncbi:MAG: endonuclease V [Myxococcota bacterium]